jgi:hypothetical protein
MKDKYWDQFIGGCYIIKHHTLEERERTQRNRDVEIKIVKQYASERGLEYNDAERELAEQGKIFNTDVARPWGKFRADVGRTSPVFTSLEEKSLIDVFKACTPYVMRFDIISGVRPEHLPYDVNFIGLKSHFSLSEKIDEISENIYLCCTAGGAWEERPHFSFYFNYKENRPTS